jgi:probable rRNA maturation factor
VSDDDVPLAENQGAATAGAPDIDVVIGHAAWRGALDEPAALCRDAAVAALDAAGFGPLAPRVELGVRLADDAELRRLNHRYRGRDAPTNVLSFAASDAMPGRLPALPDDGAPLALGDVVLALETVLDEAGVQGKTVADHVGHLVVHGVLHLVGYDHECDADANIMEGLETAVLAGLGIADPYAPTPARPCSEHGRAQPAGPS